MHQVLKDVTLQFAANHISKIKSIILDFFPLNNLTQYFIYLNNVRKTVSKVKNKKPSTIS